MLLGLEMYQVNILCYILEVVFNMFSNLLESHIPKSPDTHKWNLFAMGLTMAVTQKLLYRILAMEDVANR